MGSECVCFGPVEDICEVVVLFRDRGEINWSGLRCGGSSSGEVFEIECKLLCTRQFTCSEVSYSVDQGDVNLWSSGRSWIIFPGVGVGVVKRCLRLHLVGDGSAHGRPRVGYGILFVRSGENDTTQYPVNQQIVAGEPVVSQHY